MLKLLKLIRDSNSKPGDEPLCDFYTERFCANAALSNYYDTLSATEEDTKCPQMCHEVKYNPTITTSTFSRNYLENALPQVGITRSYDYFTENFILVRLYVTSMFYTKMTIIPAYSFSALMSDIGGSMSLVLGATLLTVVEITEMFSTLVSYFVLKVCLSRYKKEQKKRIAP